LGAAALLGDECSSFDDPGGALSFIKLPVLYQKERIAPYYSYKLEVNRAGGFFYYQK